ncbi:MAG: radical SAM protein [Acidaminococcaceae bacterium]
MERYGIITEKNPREIVLLRGSGCFWRRCRFCDYHLDCSADTDANANLNQSILNQVTGRFGILEVINSGSLPELDAATLEAIRACAVRCHLKQLHFEAHYHYVAQLPTWRTFFAQVGLTTKIKIGVETFDEDFRERVLCKGMGFVSPATLAQNFEECCLLFGLTGQTLTSMKRDIALGLEHFERLCINLMQANTAPLQPDAAVLRLFMEKLYPQCVANPRIDLLLNNTDFGVGGADHE